MATLTKHGTELLRLEYFTATVSYRADGEILRNQGNGWKRWKHVRVSAGIDPVAHAEKVRANRARCDADFPTLARFRKILSGYGLKMRSLIFNTLELMPTDPDGVWSMCDDYGLKPDLQDLVELSRLYETAMVELKTASDRAKSEKVKV